MGLTRRDWIESAGILLAEKGISAVKVEVLARTLKVSKGSFYWHFKNRPDLLNAIVTAWEAGTDWLIAESKKEATPLQRLETLFRLIGQMSERTTDNSFETGIFQWAQVDLAVGQRVAQVEAKRLDFMVAQLYEAGVPMPEAKRRVEFAYLAFLGYVYRSNRMPAYRTPEKFHLFSKLLIKLMFEALEPEEVVV